jgi:hypothetical protein
LSLYHLDVRGNNLANSTLMLLKKRFPEARIVA